MGKRPTWMPFYIADYLRDTSRLTTEGHGAYMLLIFDYWVSGKPLPDDDNQLAAVTRLAVPKWKALRPTIQQFFQVGGGLWHHKRIDHELADAENRIDKRSRAGKGGAEARWGNRNGNRNGAGIANGMAIASDGQCDQRAIEYAQETREAKLPQESKPRTNLESVTASEVEVFSNGHSFGRSAPAAGALKAKRKEQLQQKLLRFCNARLTGAERSIAVTGLCGGDPDEGEQVWLDRIDARMRRERWDDTAETRAGVRR